MLKSKSKNKQKIYQDLELPAYPANLLICDPRFYVKDWLAEHKTRRQQQIDRHNNAFAESCECKRTP